MKTLSLRAIAHAMLFAAALCWGDAQAQTVRVRVVDWITQKPIEGAQVAMRRSLSLGMGNLPMGGSAAMTDAKGEATFINFPGDEAFYAKKAGYSDACMGCPLLEKNEGGVRVRYLIPVQEVALIEIREELRLATDSPSDPPKRLVEIVKRFERAKATFEREVKRRQGVLLDGSGLCRRDERTGMNICPAGADGKLGPLLMEREEAALRRFCGLASEFADAQPGGAERKQLQEVREYCAVVR